MVFSTILVNEGNAYNSSTGVFTAPINGTYSFSAQLCKHPNKNMNFEIKVNDRTVVAKYGSGNGAEDCRFLQTVARIKDNDKVTVQWGTWSYPNTTVLTESSYVRNFFTGSLIHT
jgi:hypothetical protein